MIPRSIAAVGVLAAALLAGGVARAEAPNRTLDRWRQRLVRAEARLAASDWKRADRDLAELRSELLDLVVGGEGESEWFGRTLALQAVARAGLGDRRGAEWWWWCAQEIWPAATALDLSRFGRAGSDVGALGAPAPVPAELFFIGPPQASEEPAHELESKGACSPIFPRSKWDTYRRKTFRVIVRTEIDEEGRPWRPQIIRPGPDAGITVAGLIALYDCRYDPASMEGLSRPVMLTVRLEH
jgi:hypothetical protein